VLSIGTYPRAKILKLCRLIKNGTFAFAPSHYPAQMQNQKSHFLLPLNEIIYFELRILIIVNVKPIAKLAFIYFKTKKEFFGT